MSAIFHHSRYYFRDDLIAILADRDAQKERADEAEAKLEEARRLRDAAEASARWIQSAMVSSSSTELATNLPPDVLMSPMPFPDRLDYTAKLIQAAFDAWVKDDGYLQTVSTLRSRLAEVEREREECAANNRHLVIKHARLTTIKAETQDKLLASEAQVEQLRVEVLARKEHSINCGCNKCLRLGIILKSPPSSALHTHDLEVAERAFRGGWKERDVWIGEVPRPEEAMQAEWLASKTRRELTEGKL